MKTFNLFLGILLTGVILTSCTSTNHVATDNVLQKRKYKKGYFFSHFGNIKKSESPSSKVHELSVNSTIEAEANEKNSNTNIAVNEFVYASSGNHVTEPVQEQKLTTKIRNLYRPEITGIKEFREEYQNIKEEYKQKMLINPASEGGKGGGYSIASFVLAIVGLIVFGIICGLLAIIFGSIGLSRGYLKGLAIAGIIIGAIDIIAVLIIVASM